MKAEETAEQYRELFRLRAVGELDEMECAKSLYILLKDLYLENMRILDIPCGVGHYYRTLKKLGNIQYCGADLDEKAIEAAKEIWKAEDKARFFVYDVMGFSLLPFAQWDAVICYNLLLHLPNYRRAIINLLRATHKYLIVRSLFAKETKIKREEIPVGYENVYKSGNIYYNVWGENEIVAFIKSLGDFSCTFIDDNVVVPTEEIKRQAEVLRVSESTFSSGDGYKVLLIERND